MTSNYSLPTEFEINGELFKIRERGDFRIVLSCFNIISNVDLSDQEKTLSCLIVFYENFDDIDDVFNCKGTIEELVKQMFWFFGCGEDESEKKKNKPRLIDWDKDRNLICSAINSVAGKDIRAEEYVHWWTFVSYYMAIGECSLSTVVSIRHKMATGKKLEKYEREFRNENPQYFNIDLRNPEDKAAEDYIRALWENGGEI